MKLLLLHGPAITESRKKLSEIKKNFLPDNIYVFEEVSQRIIDENVNSLSLFSGERLFIFENWDEGIDLKINSQSDLTIVFWFDASLNEKDKILQFVKGNKGQVIFFPTEKEVTAFPFLDALGYKDKKAFIELQKLKNAGLDTQYIITMIYYLLRSLAVDNKKSPPFVKNKIIMQRQNFSDVSKLYKFVLETDYKIKNGLIDINQAEFYLVYRFIQKI